MQRHIDPNLNPNQYLFTYYLGNTPHNHKDDFAASSSSRGHFPSSSLTIGPIDGMQFPHARSYGIAINPLQHNPATDWNNWNPTQQLLHNGVFDSYGGYSESVPEFSPATAPSNISPLRNTHGSSSRIPIEYVPTTSMTERSGDALHSNRLGHEEAGGGLRQHNAQGPVEGPYYSQPQDYGDTGPGQQDDLLPWLHYLIDRASSQDLPNVLFEEKPIEVQHQEDPSNLEVPLESHEVGSTLPSVTDTSVDRNTSVSINAPAPPQSSANTTLPNHVRNSLPAYLRNYRARGRPYDNFEPVRRKIVSALSINAEMIDAHGEGLPTHLKTLCEERLYSPQRNGAKGGVTSGKCAFGSCEKSFKRTEISSKVAYHLVSKHWDLKPLLCGVDGCDAAFASPYDRARHERKKHNFVYGSQS